MSLDTTHNVRVMLANEQRFELPARFSVRVRQMLSKEFEKTLNNLQLREPQFRRSGPALNEL
jgi:hypothetical protein